MTTAKGNFIQREILTQKHSLLSRTRAAHARPVTTLDLTKQIKKHIPSDQRSGGFPDESTKRCGGERLKVLRWDLDDERDRLKKKKKKRLHREPMPIHGITQDFGLYPSMALKQ
ncbi:hypothetical protein FIBSPDRAFT_939799 [Athelia psychrophila]|uniref:Uncharacterized protein n=1 Tax=Athelia psychrophila TaxID=1759441 RepID=A0A167X6Q9_9AGAM|nr:hypothetical protein FIBSPDRAFT_939799 [Fibularhizoctonia sp. CBS 109695]